MSGEMKQAYTQMRVPKDYVIDNKSTHIYMPSREFCDWLVGCVKEDIGFKYGIIVQQSIGRASGVFHFPTSSKLPSACFNVLSTTATEKEQREINAYFGHTVSYLLAYSIDYQIDSEETRMYFENLISGLGMYIDCFPEMLTDGVPEELKHPSHHQHKIKKTLCISPKIAEKREDGNITPHFRRGHFRVLMSPVFTHKQFQTIFISETFVKGKAATVQEIK